MLYALAETSLKTQILMEQQEKIANQLALEKHIEKKNKKRICLDE